MPETNKMKTGSLKTVRNVSLIAVGLLFCTFSAVSQKEKDGLVIKNVRVFDGFGITQNPEELWIQNGRIKAVGEHLQVSAGTQAIDGSGDTVLPGLIDAHIHTFGGSPKDALIFGVTTELDMFTDYRLAQQIKHEQAEGKDLNFADIFSAGTLVTCPHGHGTEYGLAIPTISSADEAQAFVDARIAEGSDYIKIIYDDGAGFGLQYPSISKETLAAVVRAAHKRGKLAIAHIGSLQGARDAIQAGVDGLAHLFVDSPPDSEFGSFVANHHAFVVPTLSVLAPISGVQSGKFVANDNRLQPYLSPSALTNLLRVSSTPRGAFANAEAAIRDLKMHHVPILAGTDAPNPGTAHGASLHGEMQLLVDAGLTPIEALRSATSVPSDMFHLNDRGRIAAGKRADLVLVRGDPTVDITASRDIISVWKLGVADDRADYRAAIDKQKEDVETRRRAPAPEGSESGLISDFDDGSMKTKFGFGWQLSTDSSRGGTSKAEIRVVDGGAENTKCALQIQGEIAPSPAASAGVIFFPGVDPMSPVNLSAKIALTFWTKGDGRTYRVMVFSQANGFTPVSKSFVAGPEWKKLGFPLSEFNTDGRDLMGIWFGARSQPGHFTLWIDNVRLE